MKIKYKVTLFVAILASLVVLPQTFGQEEDLVAGLSVEEYLEEALPPQEGRKIDYDDISGLITVTDTPSNQQLIGELIEQYDIGPRQIMIEAKFVEVAFKDLNELGIEWYWSRRGKSDSKAFTDGAVTAGLHWDTSTNAFPLTSHGLDFFLSRTSWTTSYIRAYLHALQEENKADVLSSPRVTTLAGQMANIQVTRKLPYVSEVSLDNEGTADHPLWVIHWTLDQKETGITLEVTPYVSGTSDIITLDIHPEVSTKYAQYPIGVLQSGSTGQIASLVPDELGYPSIDIRTTQTSVVIRSGETIVMGGLIKDEDTTRSKKIPFLGDIPLLGNLFKYEYQSREKKNLMIFLTATLLTAEGEPIR